MEHPIQISIFDSCDILGITRASKSTADELTLKSGKDDQLNSVRHLSWAVHHFVPPSKYNVYERKRAKNTDDAFE